MQARAGEQFQVVFRPSLICLSLSPSLAEFSLVRGFNYPVTLCASLSPACQSMKVCGNQQFLRWWCKQESKWSWVTSAVATERISTITTACSSNFGIYVCLCLHSNNIITQHLRENAAVAAAGTFIATSYYCPPFLLFLLPRLLF